MKVAFDEKLKIRPGVWGLPKTPSRVQGPRKLLGFEHFKTHFE
jgi:hypothetical protein